MTRVLSIVGAGRLGRTLGRRLRERGWRIGAVVTRSAKTSRAAVRAIGAGTAHAFPVATRAMNGVRKGAASRIAGKRGILGGRSFSSDIKSSSKEGALAPEDNVFSQVLLSDIVLLATPDDALASVAKLLAKAGTKAWRGKVVLHTSGALDRAVLAPLARLGASTGSIHPMQTFSGRVLPKLDGVIFAIEGDAKARRAARGIAKALGGVPVAIRGRDKPVYHATAVLVCGSGFPLIESALQMLVRIGFTRRRAMQTLLPLTRQMLDNVERIGPRAAWTGPLSRGDYAVVAKHVKALRSYPREVQQAYAALALLAGRVLSKQPATMIGKLKRVLKNSSGGSR
jgi:predicted short-subunit dehydrogenase-like oxidoreductase (DUF2520 family)